jgi:probable addiction module antidote protein
MLSKALFHQYVETCGVGYELVEGKIIMNKIDQLGIAPFEASDYLDSEETIAEYLSLALVNPDPDVFLIAVRDVAKARGISTVAENAGIRRENLYKTLKPGAKPGFETIRRLVGALGVQFNISPPHSHVCNP